MARPGIGQRLLLVLDDADDSDQVRPLLPGTGGALVLITSRRRLTALDDATIISLDTLPPGDAAGLLARLAARPGLDPADPAISEIAALCGRLPLALGMVARQLYHHPAWTPAELAADLAGARDRLALMHAEDLSVAAAFDRSYQDLTAPEQKVFRCLGLHPGTDFDAYAAAALADVPHDRSPQRPGGPVRPLPARRDRPRPLPVPRPDPRARPRPRRSRPARRPRRRHRPPAGLLPARRPRRRPAPWPSPPPPPARPPASRPTPGRSPAARTPCPS